ncbi:MAG: hypothetical protein H5U40_06540, partial [Polyangiaceae bacterium]|nr:hypothetical protein [Polyangiaceae bacterium]
PAAERKKPAPSPLELAVESSTAAVEEIELPTATAAIPDSYRHEPAAAMSAEPERLAAPDVTVSSPVATVASPFVAAKPATFGELLDRTLHLKIR